MALDLRDRRFPSTSCSSSSVTSSSLSWTTHASAGSSNRGRQNLPAQPYSNPSTDLPSTAQSISATGGGFDYGTGPPAGPPGPDILSGIATPTTTNNTTPSRTWIDLPNSDISAPPWYLSARPACYAQNPPMASSPQAQSRTSSGSLSYPATNNARRSPYDAGPQLQQPSPSRRTAPSPPTTERAQVPCLPSNANVYQPPGSQSSYPLLDGPPNDADIQRYYRARSSAAHRGLGLG